MKTFKTKTKTILTLLCLVLVLPIFFGGQVGAESHFNETVKCDQKDKTDKAICTASVAKCGNKNTASDKACRKGFREGAKKSGDNKSDTCKSFSGNDKKECEKGYTSGASKRDELNKPTGSTQKKFPGASGTHQCGNLGDDDKNVKTKINFGCLGDKGPDGMGPIEDLLYALIRFLSNGVGVLMVVALIGAGIKYTTSEGNAEQTMKSKKIIQNIIIALFIYLFIYAILQFLIPGGIFK